jgi:hypothetical protein
MLVIIILIYTSVENKNDKNMMIFVMTVVLLFFVSNLLFLTPAGKFLDQIPSTGFGGAFINGFNTILMAICVIAVGIISEKVTDDKLKKSSYAVISLFGLFTLKSFADAYLSYYS